MSKETQLTLPVLGMTCANCAVSVERNARKEAGVTEAAVNLASEKVTVVFDPSLTKPQALIDRIERAGYRVPTATIDLPITGMTCANCSAAVERTLNARVPGVVEAVVNLATEKATVRYVPGAVTRADMVAAIERAGYGVIEASSEEDLVDAEKVARRREVEVQTRKLLVGVLFTVPLFVLSMARDFGLVGHWAHAPWVNVLFWVLATPVQFYTGWDYYVGGLKSLRNGSANMTC